MTIGFVKAKKCYSLILRGFVDYKDKKFQFRSAPRFAKNTTQMVFLIEPFMIGSLYGAIKVAHIYVLIHQQILSARPFLKFGEN